ncbi:MAG: glycosyltransferase N-terminal domain-containing protein [Desulfatiglandaceae bacterium]
MKGSDLFKHIARISYTALSSGLFCLLLPAAMVYTGVTGRYREGMKERLGILDSKDVRPQGAPRIWIHAASLGEINVAFSLIKAVKKIRPQCAFVLSTVTPHGRDLALKKAGVDTRIIYAPVDFIGCVQRALQAVLPDILVFVETEIWPVWFFQAKRLGIPIALVNGRISHRSLSAYTRFRPFFKVVLSHVDRFSMIGARDAERIITVGAEPGKIQVNGNAKYDALAGMADPGLENNVRRLLDLHQNTKVIVAGSTRSGEEEQIFDAYKQIVSSFPETVLIIAPRHIQRSQGILSTAVSAGFSCQLRTELGAGRRRSAQVLILDTFGELFAVYSTATIVFCGASLVPLGGQNPLEAASWGKVVCYGPFMDDFPDARALLEEAGAGFTVSGAEDLTREVLHFFRHPEERSHLGELGRNALLSHRHAADRHAKVILELLNDEKCSATFLTGDFGKNVES